MLEWSHWVPWCPAEMENTQDTWPGRGVRGHSNSGELFWQTFCFGRGFCFLCQAIIHYLERGGRMGRGEGTNTAGCQNSWPPNGMTSKSGSSNLEARSGGEGGESRGTCWRHFCRLLGNCGKTMESLAVGEPGGWGWVDRKQLSAPAAVVIKPNSSLLAWHTTKPIYWCPWWRRNAPCLWQGWCQARRTGSSCCEDSNSPMVFREGFLKATFKLRIVAPGFSFDWLVVW